MNPIEAYEKCKGGEGSLYDLVYEGAGPDGVECEVVKSAYDDWEDGGKYQFNSAVLAHEGRYYEFPLSRCGSHWQGYETRFLEPGEVRKKTKTVEYWDSQP